MRFISGTFRSDVRARDYLMPGKTDARKPGGSPDRAAP
jgi:hypothetical protein